MVSNGNGAYPAKVLPQPPWNLRQRGERVILVQLVDESSPHN